MGGPDPVTRGGVVGRHPSRPDRDRRPHPSHPRRRADRRDRPHRHRPARGQALGEAAGTADDAGAASCSFRYADSFTAANELEAYKRLLHDVLLGDPTLFNDAAGVERLWQVAAPLLQAPPAPLPYPQRSWGRSGRVS